MEMEEYRAANPKVTPCLRCQCHAYVACVTRTYHLNMLPIEYTPLSYVCCLYDSYLCSALAAPLHVHYSSPVSQLVTHQNTLRLHSYTHIIIL
jgi:hypothetical protein